MAKEEKAGRAKTSADLAKEELDATAKKQMEDSGKKPKSKTLIATQCKEACAGSGHDEGDLKQLTDEEMGHLASLVDAHPSTSHMFRRSSEVFWQTIRERRDAESKLAAQNA